MRLAGLASADLRNVARDPMLALATIAPFVVAVILRVGTPPARDALPAIASYLPFIQGFALLLCTLMFGWVIAFLVLEERDERVLAAIAVSPTALGGFLVYRLGLASVGAALAGLVAVLVSGGAGASFLKLVPVAMLGGLSAATMAAFLMAFARNKVEGLALAKLAGGALLAPFGLVVLDDPWVRLLGFVPSTWVVRAFLAVNEPAWGYASSLGIGASIHVGLLWLLVRRARALAT